MIVSHTLPASPGWLAPSWVTSGPSDLKSDECGKCDSKS